MWYRHTRGPRLVAAALQGQMRVFKVACLRHLAHAKLLKRERKPRLKPGVREREKKKKRKGAKRSKISDGNAPIAFVVFPNSELAE